MIRDQDFLVRTIFNVVSDGNRIKTFSPGFLNTNNRPHCAVRKYCMDMEVAFKSLISIESRNVDHIPVTCIAMLDKLMDVFI